MRSRNLDPLKCLPYESWTNCIQLYARDQPEGALPLLAVSKAWEKSLIETPQIWTTIHFDGGPDEECRAECFFELSKRMLVALVLDLNSAGMDVAMKYRDRIKSLVFRTVSPRRYTSLDVSRFANKLGIEIYPNLSNIHVEGPREEAVFIPLVLIRACPALVGVYGAYVKREAFPYLSPHTTVISIYGDGALPEGIGERLKVMNVFCLQVWLPGIDRSESFSIPSRRLQAFGLDYGGPGSTGRLLDDADRSLYLLRIRTFCLDTHHYLKELKFTIPWFNVSELIPCVTACPALTALEIVVDCVAGNLKTVNDDLSSFTVRNIGHVRKLHLSTGLREGDLTNLVSKNLPKALRVFTKECALIQLEELHLGIYGSTSNMDATFLEILRTTKSLKELHLKRFPLSYNEQYPETISFPRLHTLVVDYGAALEYLEAPNLVWLECKNPILRPTCIPDSVASRLEFISAPNFDFHCWKTHLVTENSMKLPFYQLKRLQLLCGPVFSNPVLPFNFSQLQSVSFDTNSRGDREDIRPYAYAGAHFFFNRFLLELFLSPGSCPRLHIIQSIVPPNWILAAVTFYQRNTLKSVTPIASLFLPRYPPVSVLGMIVGALEAVGPDLGGAMYTSPTVDDIIHRRSTLTFYREHACLGCIMSGYVTCASSMEQPRLPGPLYDPELLPFHLRTVSITAHSDREQCEQYLQRTSILGLEDYKPRCDRYNRENWVHIGAHTLNGLPMISSDPSSQPWGMNESLSGSIPDIDIVHPW